MTWEIFLGIATLVSFIVTIGKIISNNTKAIVSLEMTCKQLGDKEKEQGNDIKELQGTTADHETRITVLEHK